MHNVILRRFSHCRNYLEGDIPFDNHWEFPSATDQKNKESQSIDLVMIEKFERTIKQKGEKRSFHECANGRNHDKVLVHLRFEYSARSV